MAEDKDINRAHMADKDGPISMYRSLARQIETALDKIGAGVPDRAVHDLIGDQIEVLERRLVDITLENDVVDPNLGAIYDRLSERYCGLPAPPESPDGASKSQADPFELLAAQRLPFRNGLREYGLYRSNSDGSLHYSLGSSLSPADNLDSDMRFTYPDPAIESQLKAAKVWLSLQIKACRKR